MLVPLYVYSERNIAKDLQSTGKVGTALVHIYMEKYIQCMPLAGKVSFWSLSHINTIFGKAGYSTVYQLCICVFSSVGTLSHPVQVEDDVMPAHIRNHYNK